MDGGIQIRVKKSERFSFYSHLIGTAASVSGLVVLLAITWGQWDYLIVSLVYGFGAICLFSASSLYHTFKQRENDVSIWRKLDHVAIFIMIAGTYTPIAYIYLDGAWFWSIIGVQWTCVVLGLFFKLFYLRAPRVLSPILYMIMGWMAVIPIHILWQEMPRLAFILLADGGVAYSIGAVIYAIKKPDPFPGIFGFHEIFHIFILGGAVFHYFMVYSVIINV